MSLKSSIRDETHAAGIAQTLFLARVRSHVFGHIAAGEGLMTNVTGARFLPGVN